MTVNKEALHVVALASWLAWVATGAWWAAVLGGLGALVLLSALLLTVARLAGLALLLTVATGCTPTMRAQALIGAGATACGGGAVVATAAGESWGALLEAAGCWLADWGADMLERQRDAERRRELEHVAQVDPPELERLDEAAVELAAARATMLASPCEANAIRLAGALERCRAIAGEGARP